MVSNRSVPLCYTMLIGLVYVNNHTSVWGSWYDAASSTWGYACCHSSIHISYCSGQAGIDATQASSAQALLAATPHSPEPVKEEEEEEPRQINQNFSKQRVGEGDVQLDKARLSDALRAEKKRKKGGRDDDERSGKKSKGDIMSGSHDVTEEQLGAQDFISPSELPDRICRGLPHDSEDDGRSYGKLCRSGGLNCEVLNRHLLLRARPAVHDLTVFIRLTHSCTTISITDLHIIISLFANRHTAATYRKLVEY